MSITALPMAEALSHECPMTHRLLLWHMHGCRNQWLCFMLHMFTLLPLSPLQSLHDLLAGAVLIPAAITQVEEHIGRRLNPGACWAHTLRTLRYSEYPVVPTSSTLGSKPMPVPVLIPGARIQVRLLVVGSRTHCPAV